MNLSVVLDFLSALEQNNNRDWFHANKPWYAEANRSFEQLVSQLQQALREIDGSLPLVEPKELTFKLMRDTRFSQDKSPYNPAYRAHISSKGKLPIPVGYYLFLRPGDRSFLGGGLFADMFADATRMVRDYICAHGDAWQQVISDPVFTASFTVGGAALKNVPRGYDAGHPQAAYLKNKSWYLEYPVPDEQLLAPDFVRFAVDVYKKMQPFNAYLNRALDGFEMPAR